MNAILRRLLHDVSRRLRTEDVPARDDLHALHVLPRRLLRVAGTLAVLLLAVGVLFVVMHGGGRAVAGTAVEAQWQLPVLGAGLCALIALAVRTLVVRIERRVLAPLQGRLRRLQARERRVRLLVERMPAALCLVDAGRREALLQNALAGRHAERAGRAGLALYAALADGYAAAAPQGGVRTFELSHAATLQAPACHLRVAATELTWAGRVLLLCTLEDVTERVQQQARQHRAHEQAAAAGRAQLQLLATMGHEIRTPLHGILGHLELFARSPLDDEQRVRLRRITQSAQSLLSIIADVLDLERIEAGQLDIEPARLEPALLLERVALLYAPLAQEKGVDLDLVVDATLAPACQGPAARIEQVLRNLVSNAVKFTPSGRIELRAMPGRGRGWLRMEVVDSGIGLSERQQQRLFQPFVQADASIGERYGGSGLGLSLCRRLCRLMGGEIELRSTPGVGSVFAFDVPVRPCASAARAARPLAGRRVLVHAAVATWRDELARRLRQWGAEPVVLERLDALADDAALAALPLVLFERTLPPSRPAVLDACGRVIRVRADGPLHAAPRDGEWWVSCFAQQALLDALREGPQVATPASPAAGQGGALAASAMIG